MFFISRKEEEPGPVQLGGAKTAGIQKGIPPPMMRLCGIGTPHNLILMGSDNEGLTHLSPTKPLTVQETGSNSDS